MPQVEENGSRDPSGAPSTWQPTEKMVRRLVWLLLVVGFVLRLLPIMWGSRYYDESQYGLHADEGKIVGYAERFPASLTKSKDFRYPTLVHNTYGTAWRGLQAVGVVAGPEAPKQVRYEQALIMCRLLTVLLGVLAMFLTYRFASRLFGQLAGLWALALMNVTPLHVVYSATSMTEVPASVCLLVVMNLLLEMTRAERVSRKSVLAIGIAMGAAAAAKYPAAIGIGAFVACVGYRVFTGRTTVPVAARLTLEAAVYTCIAFFVFVPGIIWHFDSFKASLLYELNDKALKAAFNPSAFVRELRYTFSDIVLVLAIVGAGVAVIRQRSFFVLMLFGMIISFLVILARSYVSYYGIPITPYVVTFASLALVTIPRWATSRARAIQATAAAVVVLGTVFTGYVGYQRYAGDVRYRFQAWVEENIPPGPISVSRVDRYPRKHLWACPKLPRGYTQVDALAQPEWVVLCERHYRPIKAQLEGRRSRKGFRYMGKPSPEAIRFYDDVLLGRSTKYQYDLVGEFEPVDLPIGLRETAVKVYRRRTKQ